MTGIPCFSKGHIRPFCFYERSPLVAFYLKQDFQISCKKAKSKNSVQCLCCRGACIEAAHTLSSERPGQAPSLGGTCRISASGGQSSGLRLGATVLGLHLLCASISKRGLRYQKSLRVIILGFQGCSVFSYKFMVILLPFTPFQLWKVFIGTPYFWIAGEPVLTKTADFCSFSWGKIFALSLLETLPLKPTLSSFPSNHIYSHPPEKGEKVRKGDGLPFFSRPWGKGA